MCKLILENKGYPGKLILALRIQFFKYDIRFPTSVKYYSTYPMFVVIV